MAFSGYPKLTGRYLIQHKLGTGGAATVYQAYDRVLGRTVALKVLTSTANDAALLRFQREAVTAGRLRHPHIVQTYQVSLGQDGGQAFIALELVEGESLAQLLTRVGRMSPEDSCRTLAPVAQALAYAHRQGFIHRDVKPSNILLRPVHARPLHDARNNTAAQTNFTALNDATSQAAKSHSTLSHSTRSQGALSQGIELDILGFPVQPLLSDFGIARALDAPELTHIGRTVGTPAYMSPEQCAGSRAVDGRTDIYALGAVLYRCLLGHAPFRGATHQILHAHVYSPLTVDEDILAELPPEAIELLQRSMAKDPAQRFETAAEMASLLYAVANAPYPSVPEHEDGKAGLDHAINSPPKSTPVSKVDNPASTSQLRAVLVAGLPIDSGFHTDFDTSLDDPSAASGAVTAVKENTAPRTTASRSVSSTRRLARRPRVVSLRALSSAAIVVMACASVIGGLVWAYGTAPTLVSSINTWANARAHEWTAGAWQDLQESYTAGDLSSASTDDAQAALTSTSATTMPTTTSTHATNPTTAASSDSSAHHAEPDAIAPANLPEYLSENNASADSARDGNDAHTQDPIHEERSQAALDSENAGGGIAGNDIAGSEAVTPSATPAGENPPEGAHIAQPGLPENEAAESDAIGETSADLEQASEEPAAPDNYESHATQEPAAETSEATESTDEASSAEDSVREQNEAADPAATSAAELAPSTCPIPIDDFFVAHLEALDGPLGEEFTCPEDVAAQGDVWLQQFEHGTMFQLAGHLVDSANANTDLYILYIRSGAWEKITPSTTHENAADGDTIDEDVTEEHSTEEHSTEEHSTEEHSTEEHSTANDARGVGPPAANNGPPQRTPPSLSPNRPGRSPEDVPGQPFARERPRVDPRFQAIWRQANRHSELGDVLAPQAERHTLIIQRFSAGWLIGELDSGTIYTLHRDRLRF